MSNETSDKKFITVFACDVCKEARFFSKEEAEHHERNCKGPSSTGMRNNNNKHQGGNVDGGGFMAAMAGASSQQVAAAHPVANPLVPVRTQQQQGMTFSPTLTRTGVGAPSSAGSSSSKTAAISSTSVASHATNHHAPSDGIINKTLFKCRKCKLLFWTTREAALHESACVESQWYNCSVCQVLRFKSREEVAVHKRTCTGPMPLRIADLPLAERTAPVALPTRQPPAVAAPVGRSAPTAPVPPRNVPGSAVQKVEKAGAATSSGSQVPGNVNDQAHKKAWAMQERVTSIIDLYKDEVRRGSSCNVASVDKTSTQSNTSDSAARNETGSGSSSPSSVEFVGTSKPAEKPSSPNKQIAAPSNINSAAKRTSTTMSSNEKVENAPKKDMEWTTVWTCDFCCVEQFDNFDDAVAHEKICSEKKKKGELPQDVSKPPPSQSADSKGAEMANKSDTALNSATAAALASPIPPKPSPEKKSHEKRAPSNVELTTLFAPILKDSNDSTNFMQLSKYHRLVLKSLQLLHTPITLNGGCISFKCQYCSQLLLPNKGNLWTLKDFVETISSIAFAHVTGICKSVPENVAKRLPSASTSGKMPFDEFLSGFFSENGIVDKPGDNHGLVVLPEEEFQLMPG